jgi:hypothetical protein
MASMNSLAEVDEAALLEDTVRVALRSALTGLGIGWRADAPPANTPQWATPLVMTSETTGREFMLEVKAVECTDWRSER